MNFKQEDFLADMRDRAIEWARSVMGMGDQVVILDTETTGLGREAEVIQAAAVDVDGNVLFDLTCRPVLPIPAEAEAVHHITNEIVAGLPFFDRAMYPDLLLHLSGKVVVTYNVAFDRRLLRQTCEQFGLTELHALGWHCAMERYAEYVGEWNDYHRSFRWQKLEGGDHSALGDCGATLALIRRMAETRMSKEQEKVLVSQ